MTVQEIEKEIQADIEANIAAEHCFTAAEGFAGALGNKFGGGNNEKHF